MNVQGRSSKERSFCLWAAAAVALALLLAASGLSAAPDNVLAQSPGGFVGSWLATDIDGSDIRLAIGGPPGGPFQITWTESYISFCSGEAGIVRGTGQLSPGDPELLEADLWLECFTTGQSMALQLSFRYHPGTGTLSSRYENGMVLVFERPSRPLPAPPPLGLRVNYGHDWVESFYEAGHMAWVTVTESDGVTVKAVAELSTEPKDFWGGETGFQTQAQDWSPGPPDIRPDDWVYGWLDNGAAALVQIGDIRGEVSIVEDQITGTIAAPWIEGQVQVECLDWGSGGEPINKDAGFITPDGIDSYTCAWDPETEWDVQAWQDIGVGYLTPEGNWVANAFRAEHWAAFWTYDLEAGFWSEGDHNYTFQWEYTDPKSGGGTNGPWSMTVEDAATPIYPGYALLQPWADAPQLAWTGSACEAIPVVHPDQPTRFVWGWVNDFSMSYEDALDYFENFVVHVSWDDGVGGPVKLLMGDLEPFTNRDERWELRCSLTEHPPAMGLRVNYGHNWVESFYEAGHTVAITVTEADGETVRATAELVTEPKDFWNGETGFQTQSEDWDSEPPDIQPDDWVLASVDNGVSAQVQIGDISGEINLADDFVEGAISVPWFSDPLDVECHPWGAPEPAEMKYASVVPDGADPYVCSWAGEWDIQPGQDVGVGYFGPDGHWVANAFSVPRPSFAAYMPGTVEGYDWPMGHIITLIVNDGTYIAQAPSEQREGFPEGDTRVLFELWQDGFSVQAGDHIVMMDEATEAAKDLWVASLQVTSVDSGANMVSGNYEPAYSFWMQVDGQKPLEVQFDGNTWQAAFEALTPGTWGYVAQDDDDADGTVWDFHVPPPFWRDEFDGDLLEPWSWINENVDKWSLTDQPDSLRIYAADQPTGGENLLRRPVAEGDFVIETHLFFEPDSNFQFAGLVIYQDEDDFLQFGRAFCDVPGACVGNGLYFDQIRGGDWVDGNFARAVDSPSEAYLRLERRGDMVRALYSADGLTWFEIGAHWIPAEFQVNGVGLTASQNGSAEDMPADFDYFELTEGWGFLPEGFHDYDQGDVPDWACNAGGWAVDPDDRDMDLWVALDVDAVSLPGWALGHEYRPDLEEAGLCVDGNCGYFAPLWDRIAAYETHTISAYARDFPTGEWVLLSNSPKPLTCRSYDIYLFDTETGTTRPVTMSADTNEYNPRWSPDGRRIAHNSWDFNTGAHGIYITDVESGISVPLAGAENGSYPAWSPNGRWIAFDYGSDNDFRLFIVPPAGGTPQLVREDAFMASWAPNSQRLVFHQPSDDSIRSVDLNGGRETLIVEYGQSPSWSPNGRWIAFTVDGALWKVGVDMNGNPRGAPIQLTDGASWRPAWSQNSQTIAFHSELGSDTDIWTIPAAGGAPTWLTGAPLFGDYDPNYSPNGRYIAYASFSPAGQAARSWVAAFTYDLPAGSLEGGASYPYHFEFEWTMPEPGAFSGQGGEVSVSNSAPLYDGCVLLRGPMALQGIELPEGLVCEEVEEINPNQPARFLIGWVPDQEMTYAEALAHFDDLTARVVWGEGLSAELVRHEVVPFSWNDLGWWFQYVCTFTRKRDLSAPLFLAGEQLFLPLLSSGG